MPSPNANLFLILQIAVWPWCSRKHGHPQGLAFLPTSPDSKLKTWNIQKQFAVLKKNLSLLSVTSNHLIETAQTTPTHTHKQILIYIIDLRHVSIIPVDSTITRYTWYSSVYKHHKTVTLNRCSHLAASCQVSLHDGLCKRCSSLKPIGWTTGWWLSFNPFETYVKPSHWMVFPTNPGVKMKN